MNSSFSDDDTRFVHGGAAALTRLRGLFGAVAELPRDARADWIATHVTDADEKAALLDLLAADDVDSGLLDTPAGEIATLLTVDGATVESFIGQRIGAFRLARLLGKGGMADVFLGEREEESFRQQVAVKLLRRGLYSQVERRLFLRERQVLASLAHPNIARLFDGGVTEAGIPFLVMEYVDGDPITRYAAARRLAIRERLELLLIVCRAVEAAHRALVVHRDIKPANILVDAQGTVKLLDFGIAKLLEDDIENPTIGLFTPDYAAPEQIQRGAITTATDVYALGVLMHELLLGSRPSAESPCKPSAFATGDACGERAQTGLAAHQLRNALQGDLDNIILKALAVEPEQRYASASAFADDIRRYLDGRPIAAHPPSGWYRARKFIARHKGGVAMTLAFVLVLLTAFVAVLWQADVARREAHRANTVRDFVESIFDPLSSGTVEKQQPTYAELLGSSVGKLDADPDLGAAERVDLLLLFARLNDKIGEYDKAQALADRAGVLADRELGPDHPLRDEALVESGLLAEHHGLTAKADANLAQGEASYRRAGIRGDRLIALYVGLSALADDHGDANAEVRYARLALDETLAAFPADEKRLASAYHNLGFALDTLGDFDGAASAYRKSYASDLKQFPPESFETGVSLATLGIAEGQSGRLREGRADLQHAHAIFAHSTKKPRELQADDAGYLCTVETAMSAAEAPQSCAESLALAETIYGTENPSYALAQRLEGKLHIERGELDEARAMLDASAAGLAADETRTWRGRTEINLGELDWLEGHRDAAVGALSTGVNDLGAGYPPTLRRYGLAFLALACRETRDARCAADAYRRASGEIAATSYAWSAVMLPAQTALARVELDDGNPTAAIERLRQAIAHATPEVEPQSPRLADAQLWLALADARAGDCTAARAARAHAPDAIEGRLLSDVHNALHAEKACDLSALK